MNFSSGRCCLELAQTLSCVALAWHKAGGSTPFGVTIVLVSLLSLALALLLPYCDREACGGNASHIESNKIAKSRQDDPSLRKGQ